MTSSPELPVVEDSNVQVQLQRLQHDLDQFEAFIDGLPDAVVVIDLTTNHIVALNLMTTIVMGFTQEDVEAGLSARRLAPVEEFYRMAEISAGFIARGLEAGGGTYQRSNDYNAFDVRLLRRDGSEFHAEVQAAYVVDDHGQPRQMRGIIRDISARVKLEHEHRDTIARLEAVLLEVRTLRGLIPICAWCHKIRDDKGYWQQLEIFIRDNSDADFTHSICDVCEQQMMRDRPQA